jgi:hypothetical protein
MTNRARLAKIKQESARKMTKRGQGLGREYLPFPKSKQAQVLIWLIQVMVFKSKQHIDVDLDIRTSICLFEEQYTQKFALYITLSLSSLHWFSFVLYSILVL